MQQWDDEGIIISVRRHGEQSAVVRVLTAEHGLCAGMTKGAFSKLNRGMYQAGNRLHLHWQARLEEHLGTMRGELLHSVTAELLTNSFALKLVNAMVGMVQAIVPERIVEKEIYAAVINLLWDIADTHLSLKHYALFELTLLQALGFGLDLRECVATGSKEELIYVSPKSGRAVCRDAGKPYKTKMLALPAFFHDSALSPKLHDIQDALRLTGYFIEHWLFVPESKKMPDARAELLKMVYSNCALTPA